MRADCHIHMVLDGENWKSAVARHEKEVDVPYVSAVLERYRELGYSYLRDGGDRWGVGAAAREIAGEYGICYRTPLAPLYKKGHYGAFIGTGWDRPEDYARLVRQHREAGADFIKVMVSGLMDFDRFGVLTQEGLKSEEIAAVVKIAHEEGFSVMAHCNGAETALAAAAAGVDSIEHGAYLNREALHAMKESGTVWVPTLSAIGNLRGKGRFSDAAVEKILESALENVAAFAAMGGLVAPGTDAGAWAVPHGCQTEEALLSLALGKDTGAVLKKGIAAIKERF